jgi:GxxExxY protein
MYSRKAAKARSCKFRETAMNELHENEIAKIVVDVAFHIHKVLGPGLLESVYEVIMEHELLKRGLRCERQLAVPIIYNGITFDQGFRIDLLVEGKVVVELKSIEEIEAVHKKIVLTYLKLSNKRLGLLINFGASLIKDGITRLVNGLTDP